MAHTNETPNYHLPQYVGTDIINPLVDTNGAYSAIDTALKDIADNEVADGVAIDALEATVGDNTAGLVKDVADIQTEIGDSILTTDAQTLTAAINEIDSHTDTNTQNISTNAGNITALQTNKADASSVTALSNSIGGLSIEHFYQTIEITADGVKTNEALINEALTALLAVMTSNPDDYFEILNIIASEFWLVNYRQATYNSTIPLAANLHGSNINSARTAFDLRDIDIAAGAVSHYDEVLVRVNDGTITASDIKATVPTSGDKIYLHYRQYRSVKQ